MSSTATGALVGAALGLAAAPYLARLTVTVPDAEARRWWLGAPTTPRVAAATAALAAGLGALAGAAAGWSALLPAFLAVALIGTPLVVIDLRVHRLPNRLVLAALLAEAALLTVAAAQRDDWGELLRAAEGAAAAFAALAVLWFIAPRSFGFGDVKLGGVLGGYLGWFGWAHVYYGIFAGFLLGAVLSIGLLATRRATMKTAIPFGPMLVVGPLVVLAFDLVP
jgi:leader peptidase (prepilin peptidase) / N-methyltransferase